MYFWVNNIFFLNLIEIDLNYIRTLGLLLVPNGEDLGYAFGDYYPYNDTVTSSKAQPQTSYRSTASESSQNDSNQSNITPHPWGILFTILGTVLLDFDADACQSPARAYLLDVTIPGMCD